MSLLNVNGLAESEIGSRSSGGLIISGAVHLHARAVLEDTNSEGSIKSDNPTSHKQARSYSSTRIFDYKQMLQTSQTMNEELTDATNVPMYHIILV